MFVESNDDKIHFGFINSTDNIFGVIINIKGYSTQKAKYESYKIVTKYKTIYDDCEFIFLPSKTEKNQIIKLTNTDKMVDLLF